MTELEAAASAEQGEKEALSQRSNQGGGERVAAYGTLEAQGGEAERGRGEGGSSGRPR